MVPSGGAPNSETQPPELGTLEPPTDTDVVNKQGAGIPLMQLPGRDGSEFRADLALDNGLETTQNGQKHGPGNAGKAAHNIPGGDMTRTGGSGGSIAPTTSKMAAPAVDLNPKLSSQAVHNGGTGTRHTLDFKGRVVNKFRRVEGQFTGRQAHDLELTFFEEPSVAAKESLLKILKQVRQVWFRSGPNGEDLDYIEKTNSGVNPRTANMSQTYLLFKYKSEEDQQRTLEKAQKHIEEYTEDGVKPLVDNAVVSLAAFSPKLHNRRVIINRATKLKYPSEANCSDAEVKQKKLARDGRTWNQVVQPLMKEVILILDQAGSDNLDIRAVFRNHGQYGLQLGMLVLNTPNEATKIAEAIDGKAYSGVKISAKVDELPIEKRSIDLDVRIETWPAEVMGLATQERKDTKAVQHHLNEALTQDRYKKAFGLPGSEPVVSVLTDQCGLTLVHLRSAEMRRLLARNYKSVYVPGLGRRLDFRGPSKVISQVSMEQRRRVRSQSPDDKDEQSELESGQCSEQNSPQRGRAGSNAAATGKRAAAEDARALRNQARGSQKKPAPQMDVSPSPVAACGSQEREDEYMAPPRGRTPGVKNKRNALTPDQDSSEQANASEETVGVCKTRKTLALSPPTADHHETTPQAELTARAVVAQHSKEITSKRLDAEDARALGDQARGSLEKANCWHVQGGRGSAKPPGETEPKGQPSPKRAANSGAGAQYNAFSRLVCDDNEQDPEEDMSIDGLVSPAQEDEASLKINHPEHGSWADEVQHMPNSPRTKKPATFNNPPSDKSKGKGSWPQCSPGLGENTAQSEQVAYPNSKQLRSSPQERESSPHPSAPRGLFD